MWLDERAAAVVPEREHKRSVLLLLLMTIIMTITSTIANADASTKGTAAFRCMVEADFWYCWCGVGVHYVLELRKESRLLHQMFDVAEHLHATSHTRGGSDSSKRQAEGDE
jgi:hypothetical protein